MKDTIELVNGFRDAATLIDKGFYQWTETTKCNLGVLSQVLGASELSIKQGLYGVSRVVDGVGTWRAGDRCTQTDLRMFDVFRILLDAGLEVGDFYQIEFMPHLEGLHYSDPKTVSREFRKWADQIEARLISTQVQKSRKLQPVRQAVS